VYMWVFWVQLRLRRNALTAEGGHSAFDFVVGATRTTAPKAPHSTTEPKKARTTYSAPACIMSCPLRTTYLPIAPG
jgi:hypothetical protein